MCAKHKHDDCKLDNPLMVHDVGTSTVKFKSALARKHVISMGDFQGGGEIQRKEVRMYHPMPIEISFSKPSPAMRNERRKESQLLHFSSTNSDGPMPDTYRDNNQTQFASEAQS